jgi:hypothetical protein
MCSLTWPPLLRCRGTSSTTSRAMSHMGAPSCAVTPCVVVREHQKSSHKWMCITILVLPVLINLRILTLPIQSIRRYHNHELGGKRRETRRGWQHEACGGATRRQWEILRVFVRNSHGPQIRCGNEM